MSCKVLDFENFTPQESSCCSKYYPDLYSRFYISKEEMEELMASADFETVGNSEGEMLFVRKEETK